MRKIFHFSAVISFCLLLSPAYCSEFSEWAKKADKANDDDVKIEHYTKAIETWSSLDGAEALALIYDKRGGIFLESGNKYQNEAVKVERETGQLPKQIWENGLQLVRKAAEDYSSAIKLDPNNAGYYINRGRAYFSLFDYKKTVKDCSKAIEMKPGLKDAYFWRGLSYKTLRKHKLAEADLAKNKELDPDYWVAQGDELSLKKEKHDEAIAAYSKALQLKPDHYNAYNGRGLTYKCKEMFNEAITDLSKAIELEPRSTMAYINRGSAYDKKGAYDKAIEDYNKVIELKPGNFAGYNSRGITYQNQGAYDRAVDDYNKVAELDPESGKYLDKRRKQAYAAYAPQLLEACHKAKPQKYNEPTEEMRKLAVEGDALAEEKRYSGAIQKYRQALEQGIWFAAARYNLANMCAALKDYEGAILQMKCYLEFAPDEAGARAAKDAIYGWGAKAAVQTSK